jgi:predicted RNA-binding protein with PIN domain
VKWLIDGYNVIRRDPDLRGAEAESLEAGRRALLARLAEHARSSSDRFIVVFDGAPVPGRASVPGRLEVVFSRPPSKADDVLVRLARREGAGGVVVTSDRAVGDAARRVGCTVIDAEEFLARLGASDPSRGDEDERDQPGGPVKRGNPRRLSKRQRAASRALRRLDRPRE